MQAEITVVDAFADQSFAGNPAAVCLLSFSPHDQWLQLVAREMNLSETAFLLPDGKGFRLRWFTPKSQVALSVHATLASAHVLWEQGRIGPDEPARFNTRSGLLTARREDQRIVVDFPAVRELACEVPPGLTEALGVKARYVGKNAFDYLVEIDSERAVRELQPDFARLASIPARGVMVTARSDDPAADFVSRFFAPRSGIPEDPVTGSAHCCLGPYWSSRVGKVELVGRQLSARGGVVHVRVAEERVFLGGQAVTVLRGQLSA